MRKHMGCCLLLSAALASACQDAGGPIAPDRGSIPRADARVVDHDGKLVLISDEAETVTLTLDASHSSDQDGTIAKYRWLSGTRDKPAAGQAAGAAALAPRTVPADAEPDWPDDVERPSVELADGSYVFSLWVIDDRGLVSAPDSVRVVVARPLAPDTQACIEAVPAAAPPECARCVCDRDDACREVATASACADGCWNLAVCITRSCPGFHTGDDTTCITAHCAMYLPGSSFVNQLHECTESCSDCHAQP